MDQPDEKPIVNEALSRALHDLTDLGIITTDTELRITGWNRWMEVHTGKSAAEVLHAKLTDLYPQVADRRLDKYYQTALKGRVVVLAQRFHRYLLPMPMNVGINSVPLMEQSARIAPLIGDQATIGTLTIIEDVSERVNYDSQLASHASRQLAISVLSQLALRGTSFDDILNEVCRLAASTLNVSHAAIFARPNATEGFRLKSCCGWSQDHLGSEIASGSLHWHALEALRNNMRATIVLAEELRGDAIPLMRDSGVRSGICIALPAQGDEALVLAAYTTLPREFNADEFEFLKAIAGIVGMAQHRQQLLHELQAKVEDLAQADRRKDEFLAILAHELRNPLAPIRNALHIIRLAGDNDAIQQASDVMDRQVVHMVRLVNDLLDMSRISQGKIELRRERIALESILLQAAETSRPGMDQARQKLNVSLPEQQIYLRADPIRLAQVFSNLLNNASKFSPAESSISLSALVEKNDAIVTVCDTGVGIPAEMSTSIFDMFIQVDRSLERNQSGLGIGLTLVRRLVELHGGSVLAKSAGAGMGSEFIVRLPLDQEAVVPENVPSAGTAAPFKRLKMLVVDDNKDAAVSLGMLLRISGHGARTAHDGLAALELAEQYRPDVVVLDIGLPKMNGYDVSRRIREAPWGEKMIVIALTGWGQEDDRRKSREAGFDGHIVKPVDLAELQKLMAEVQVRSDNDR